MKILILGAKGRLGAALARKWSGSHQVGALSRSEVDVFNLRELATFLSATSFDLLVNCTASTNVDRCETSREEAEVVNSAAPALMAQIAASKKAPLIHFSTDYVFDGRQETPYTEADLPNPISVYGQTKLDGENAVLSVSSQHLVARVSWVFGPDKPSFLDMILDRALANDQVAAVADKTSCPTYSEDVAVWLEPSRIRNLPGGLYHACNSGSCTWREYGQFALDRAAEAGAPLKAREVGSLKLEDMKQFVAARPVHTVLSPQKLASAIGETPRHWHEAVRDYVRTKFSH